MSAKKNQNKRTSPVRPFRTLDAEALGAVTGGLNFTKITYSYSLNFPKITYDS